MPNTMPTETSTMIEKRARGIAAPSVAAVVVTYNRKELLARCLNGILSQTRAVDRIIVVDNCSTDGTGEFLRERGFLENSVIDYTRLDENFGSAGGFHAGMKRGRDGGFEWLWVMDDDGLPFPDTLARLLDCPASISFRGCVILNSEDPARDLLTFGIETPAGAVHKQSELEQVENADGVVRGFLNPYNGMLISRPAIERIGLPTKGLFIWGDETEYFLRAKKADIQIGTVVGAKFLHPPDRMLWKRIKLGPLRFGLPYSEDPFRLYLIVRNQTYIALRYHGALSPKFLKLFSYALFFPNRSRLVLRAWLEGGTGRLKGNKVPIRLLAGRHETSRT